MQDKLRERKIHKHNLGSTWDNGPVQRRQLFYYHELDDWQKDNHYIRAFYVKETSSFLKSFQSLFYLHNESVNIYSHLLPAFLILYFLISFLLRKIITSENLVLFQFGFGAYVCFSLSAYFHLFKSHSPRVCKFGNQCDYFGIVVMITTSLVSITVLAFDDTPKLKFGFVFLFTTLGALCTKVTFDSKFSKPEYRPFRSAMFILFGLSGVLPIIVAVCTYGYEIAILRSSAYWLLLEGIFYIVGACLYAMRVPERFTHNERTVDRELAGKLDLFGHLHQIFHFMVVIAAFCHWNALKDCFSKWQVRNGA